MVWEILIEKKKNKQDYLILKGKYIFDKERKIIKILN